MVGWDLRLWGGVGLCGVGWGGVRLCCVGVGWSGVGGVGVGSRCDRHPRANPFVCSVQTRVSKQEGLWSICARVGGLGRCACVDGAAAEAFIHPGSGVFVFRNCAPQPHVI